jgi:hypothetical protein
MDWKCTVCGKTFKRERQVHTCFTGGDPELAFHGAKAKWLPLYLELFSIANKRLGFIPEYPPSGGVQWRKRSVFAGMHGESSGLHVVFFSDQRRDDIKAETIYQMSANRIAHGMVIADTARISELMDLIEYSYVLTGQANESVP